MTIYKYNVSVLTKDNPTKAEIIHTLDFTDRDDAKDYFFQYNESILKAIPTMLSVDVVYSTLLQYHIDTDGLPDNILFSMELNLKTR